MKTPTKLAALAAFALALSGCTTVVKERVVVHDRVPVIHQAPAPIQEVIPPAPAVGFAWIQGHWAWHERAWQWQQGHWQQGAPRPMPALVVEQIPSAPTPAHFWVPGHWHWHNNDWEWTRGHWER